MQAQTKGIIEARILRFSYWHLMPKKCNSMLNWIRQRTWLAWKPCLKNQYNFNWHFSHLSVKSKWFLLEKYRITDPGERRCLVSSQMNSYFESKFIRHLCSSNICTWPKLSHAESAYISKGITMVSSSNTTKISTFKYLGIVKLDLLTFPFLAKISMNSLK